LGSLIAFCGRLPASFGDSCWGGEERGRKCSAAMKHNYETGLLKKRLATGNPQKQEDFEHYGAATILLFDTENILS
jgi:hypothetical protein